MRPHVETIDEKDLIWHLAELVGGHGTARQRNLAYDEEDGSARRKIHFATDWTRPAGVHHAQTEWYVLEGEVRIGDTVLGPGGYWMAPAGVVHAAAHGRRPAPRSCYFREYGDWRFDAADADRGSVRPDQELVVVDARRRCRGSTSRTAARCASTSAARRSRASTSRCCFRDAKTGFYTPPDQGQAGLARAPAGPPPGATRRRTASRAASTTTSARCGRAPTSSVRRSSATATSPRRGRGLHLDRALRRRPRRLVHRRRPHRDARHAAELRRGLPGHRAPAPVRAGALALDRTDGRRQLPVTRTERWKGWAFVSTLEIALTGLSFGRGAGLRVGRGRHPDGSGPATARPDLRVPVDVPAAGDRHQGRRGHQVSRPHARSGLLRSRPYCSEW